MYRSLVISPPDGAGRQSSAMTRALAALLGFGAFVLLIAVAIAEAVARGRDQLTDSGRGPGWPQPVVTTWKASANRPSGR